MYAIRILTADQLRLKPVPGFQHSISKKPKRIPNECSYGRFVFHQYDGFGSTGESHRRCIDFSHLDRPFDNRQIDREFRSLAGMTLHHNMAVALFDNAIDRRESKARTLSLAFCCKKWLKHSCLRVAIHSTAGIAHS